MNTLTKVLVCLGIGVGLAYAGWAKRAELKVAKDKAVAFAADLIKKTKESVPEAGAEVFAPKDA